MGDSPSETTQLRNQLTTQLPLMWFSLAFIAGIILASLLSVSAIVWLILSAVIIIFALLVNRIPKLSAFRIPLIFFILLRYGHGRGNARLP